LLPPREFPRPPLLQPLQADAFETFKRPHPPPSPVQLQPMQCQFHILERTEYRDEIKILKNKTELIAADG